MIKKLVLMSIRVYQKTLSFDTGWPSHLGMMRRCRFHPTCSEYMYQSIECFGVVRGMAHGLARLIRCHPWNPGGYDPVPKS